nr:ribonuclease H-like domain-containing protein [Tanacetum cinerariifolium]
MDLDFATDGNLRELSGEEAWEAIENFAQGQKEWDNPPNIISEQEIENLKVHAKRLFGNKNVWVEMHRNIAWDKVKNPNPQSTPQVLLSFEEYTPPVTYPEEVEETLGTPIEVEPLDKTPLEDLGLNSCNHDIPISSREIPNFNKLEPQPQPLLSLLGQSGSQCIDFSNMEMREDDWELEPIEVSFFGRRLNFPVRPKEVENVLENQLLSVSLLTCLGKCDCVERIPAVTVFMLPYPDSG